MRISKIISVISGIIVIAAVLNVTGIAAVLWSGAIGATVVLGLSLGIGEALYRYRLKTDSRYREWQQTGC